MNLILVERTKTDIRIKKVEKCQGRSYKDKVPVFGILQRNGKLIAKVVERTDMEHLLPIIKKYIKKGSVIYTDGLEYSGITDDYIIRSVNHSARLYGYFEFDETDAMIMVCNNGIENAWSHLKRTIFGTYYHVSRKYMQKYVDEYVFDLILENLEILIDFIYICNIYMLHRRIWIIKRKNQKQKRKVNML